MTIVRALPAVGIGMLLSGAAFPVAAAAAQCTRAWTGSVQYSRSHANSSSKTEDRISGKGTETTNWSTTFKYTAQVSVREGPDRTSSIAKANIGVSSVSTETKTANDRHICPHERTPRAMSGSFASRSQSKGGGSGLDADVTVSMDSDGAYRVGVRLPDVAGTASGSTSSSFSGQCTPRKGVNHSLAEMPTRFDGVKFSTGGADRVSPDKPDQLSGSYSESYGGVTETLSWSLRRCGGALRLVKFKLEDMRFPNWEDWQEIKEQTGTTDGNIVRFTAVVANDSGEEKPATVKFKDLDADQKAGGASEAVLDEITVDVPPGEEREVTFKWDSSGYAWYDDGRPRITQRIRAELADGGKKAGEETRNLKVAPKPLVLVHGLWSNWKAWESWQGILSGAHSSNWKAFPVGQHAQFGRMRTGDEVGNLGPTNTIAQNAGELERYIKYAQRERNAWHIDLVAHSMGGLISRRYIHAAMPTYPDGKPQVQHLVMLGTPNMGSRCADLISLPLEAAGRSMEALRELRPSVVAQFNAAHTNRKGVEFSILAGNPLPAICYMYSPNDGVVTVPSAFWAIADRAQQSLLHTDMANEAGFKSFVKSRVALGPGKQSPEGQLAALEALASKGGSPSTRTPAKDSTSSEPPKLDFTKIVKLSPGQTIEIPFDVPDADNFGLTYVAPPKVGATVVDEGGAVQGTNPPGTPSAQQIFRSIFVGNPISKAKWTLMLENEDEEEREVVVSGWSNAK